LATEAERIHALNASQAGGRIGLGVWVRSRCHVTSFIFSIVRARRQPDWNSGHGLVRAEGQATPSTPPLPPPWAAGSPKRFSFWLMESKAADHGMAEAF